MVLSLIVLSFDGCFQTLHNFFILTLINQLTKLNNYDKLQKHTYN